jgi:hypothetical protein
MVMTEEKMSPTEKSDNMDLQQKKLISFRKNIFPLNLNKPYKFLSRLYI